MSTSLYTEYLKAGEYATSSIKADVRLLTVFLNWLAQENIKPEEVRYTDILAYIKYHQRKSVSQQVIQNYLNAVRLYYDCLQEHKKITHHPLVKVKLKGINKKKVYYALQSHELNGLYNNYPTETIKDKRDKVIIGLFIYQGVKKEEVEKLTIQDLKLREGKIEIPAGRRSNSRELPLEAHQVIELYDYLMQVRPQILAKRDPGEKLFPTLKRGAIIHGRPLLLALQKINPKLKDLNQIRASVIIKWLRIYNLREVQYMAGHRYINSTEAYLQSEMEGLQEEVNQYHPLDHLA